MIKIGVIIMALVSLLNAGWFSNFFDSTPTPRHTLPVDLSKVGNIAETDIRIDERYSVYVELDYDYRLQQDQFNRNKFKKIVEKYFRPTNGIFPVFPIKITIMKYEKASVIMMVDKIYYTNSSRSSSDRLIDEFNLDKGKYHIKVEAVKNCPELADLTVELAVGYIRTK